MDGNVQTDAASEGAASPTPASAPIQEQVKQEAPLTVEALQKILADERETSRRLIQSEKDRALAEVQRARNETAQHAQRARTAEGSLQKVKQRFEEDPDTQEKVRLAELEAKEQFNAEQQQGWEKQQQAQAVERQFYEDMGESLKTLGVNLNDKRIDWAAGVPDYRQRMMKIMASASTILRQDTQGKEKKTEQGWKEEIAQLRKDLGIDRTGESSGQKPTNSDKEFLKKWGDGDIPATKTNMDRANKLLG